MADIKKSSLGTIIFTTNIPGDKEYTLDPNNISYSDNPDLKITRTTNKFYSYNDKIINPSFFKGKTRSSILSILFNKNRFEQFAYPHFENSDNDKKENITKNALSYIENIFTTFPKSYNIKQIANVNKPGGLKLSIPFTSIPYTYLKVNGTDHTVSRVVYYDDTAKDDISVEILNDLNEFSNWIKGKDFDKVFREPLVKNFTKLFDEKNTKNNNLFNTFGEGGGGTFAADIERLDTEKKTNEQDILNIDEDIKIINNNLNLPSDRMIGTSSGRFDYTDIKAWFIKNKKEEVKDNRIVFTDLDAVKEKYNSKYSLNTISNFPTNMVKWTKDLENALGDKTKMKGFNGGELSNVLRMLQYKDDPSGTNNEKKYWLFEVEEEEKKLEQKKTEKKNDEKKN
jgi:hypothetical protein